MTQRHITRYASSSEYDQDFDNLDFPNVSYIEEGDEVRYVEEHPYMITGKSTYTSPFTVAINGTNRTVTLNPDTGDWEINIKSYMPLTRLNQFASSKTSIKSISFPKTFDTSNVTSLENMFYECSAITSLSDISGWGVGNVNNMHNMFRFCSALTSFPDISGWDVGNVTTMEYMFASCRTLTSFPDISGWGVGNVTNMYYMFAYCEAITSFPDISGWDTSKVTRMGGMFRYCKNLATIEGLCAIGDGTKSVDTIDMFSDCSKLTTINKAGAIHNTVILNYPPLTLDSAKVILNALSTPYNGAQTLTFSTTTKGYINADSEALALVAEKQAIGWTIAL